MSAGKAQSSIEFLMLLAASTAVLLVLVGASKSVFFSGLFALDIQTAQGFLSELNAKSDMLSFFGEGSILQAKASFFGSARIFSEDGFVLIEVKSPVLVQSKLLSQKTSTDVNAFVPETSGPVRVELVRTGTGVLIKDGDP
ncbi:MAG: hypothetical protein HY392_04285 [Candidatus Diapherotrites archaeon]|nr:hypothetical protein [Candidatus Diapherotrites archaeon]